MAREKLSGYEFYRKVLGSPKCVVAPMVDQSELAFRTLTRRHGAQLVYTPMINAKMFTDTTHKYYREQYFDIASLEEGSPSDRPLIVQFCANSPEHLLNAAKLVQDHCDGVDINLGCPQEIAKRGHYGSFLQDEWELIFEMINTLHKNLSVPVTAKFRIFPSIEKTVEYAKMLERAGAQIITCHGRTREQRGVNTGLASYEHIKAVKSAVSVPVFANGNILFPEDIARCIAETGADGVMSAEGVLYNPAIFANVSLPSSESSPSTSASVSTSQPIADLALSYLAIVRSQRTRTSPSAVKGHLFKILRPALGRPRYHDLREQIGRVRVNVPRVRPVGNGGDEGCEGVWDWVDAYVKIVEEAKVRLKEDAQTAADNGRIPLDQLVAKDDATGLDVWPHWVSQPYFRALPPCKVEKGKGEEVKGKKTKKSETTSSDTVQPPDINATTIPAKRPAATTDEDLASGADRVISGHAERVKRAKVDPPPASEAIVVPS